MWRRSSSSAGCMTRDAGGARRIALARQGYESRRAGGRCEGKEILPRGAVCLWERCETGRTTSTAVDRASRRPRSPAAERMLGIMYAIGMGIPPNDVHAGQWLEKAATQGDSYAQYGLGTMYDDGIGVPQDYVMAQHWYEQAAAQNDAHAQYKLGWLYHSGKGVPSDYAQARQWYVKAAAQGWAEAQRAKRDIFIDLGAAYRRITRRHDTGTRKRWGRGTWMRRLFSARCMPMEKACRRAILGHICG